MPDVWYEITSYYEALCDSFLGLYYVSKKHPKFYSRIVSDSCAESKQALVLPAHNRFERLSGMLFLVGEEKSE
ncbi:hypothetical protein KIN20_022206 [Parelaphostrongylus tenuis]|uniref:Uncharacterized protein n=1 Tax=Parelaphostrongylus tenuis TaxID=148309 RepID=A0AAD5MQB8_PARTN|nr:hypothetical protein KIN20_022206 [Parelaphostrongylus tenuis]